MIDWSLLKTAGELAAEESDRARAEKSARALAYLNSTNWYFIRLQETGAPIPEDIAIKRAEAWSEVAE